MSADAAIAGDNDQDVNTSAAIFFKINKLHNVWAGYRYLRIGNQTESDVGTLDVTFIQQGPMLGWAFTF